MKKKYLIVLIVFLTVTLSAYNVFRMISKGNENSLKNFIEVDEKKQSFFEYNFLFITSPLDCPPCTQFLLQKEFLILLRNELNRLNKKVSINFLIFGDISRNEKIEFVEEIKDSVNVNYLEKKGVKKYLNSKLKNAYTPVLLIVDHKYAIKYWRHFKVTGLEYEKPFIKLIDSLEQIL